MVVVVDSGWDAAGGAVGIVVVSIVTVTGGWAAGASSRQATPAATASTASRQVLVALLGCDPCLGPPTGASIARPAPGLVDRSGGSLGAARASVQRRASASTSTQRAI